MNRSLFFLAVLSLCVWALGACTPGTQAFGFIEGHVTIGPLVPVIREGEAEPTPNPEVYAAREVVVFKKDGKTEFSRITIDANGKYRGKLPVGTYVVDINHAGIDTASSLPVEIEITDQGVVRLDIDIDTGIR